MISGSDHSGRHGHARCLRLIDWYGEIAIPGGQADAIAERAASLGLSVVPLAIDLDEFAAWAATNDAVLPPPDPAAAPPAISGLLGALRREKLLEFYLTVRLFPRLGQGTVADVGCGGRPSFLEKVAAPLGADCIAVDPALPRGQGRVHGIQYVPDRVCEAGSAIAPVDLITAHCSFEMFSPADMASVLALAESRLRPGGMLLILPLYLAPQRIVYTDAALPPPGLTPEDEAEAGCRVGVEDFWGLGWTEWLSPRALRDRLVTPFPSLRFSLLRVTNARDVTPASFLRFIGRWEKV